MRSWQRHERGIALNRTLPARRGAASYLKWRPLALYAVLLALSFGLCAGAYAFFPALQPLLVLEDGVVENATIAFYALGAGALALGLANRAFRFRGAGVLAAVCVLGILEELSYGQRLFPSLVFPTLPSGMTFDALHDLARITVKGFERLGVPWYGGFVLSALSLAAVAAWLLRRRLRDILRAVSSPRSAWLYVALGVGLAVAALFIDSQGRVAQKWVLLEEVLEMNAALSLAFAAGVGVFFARRGGRTHD